MEFVWHNRQERQANCESCPGCDAPYPLGGIGDPHADIMLVGQEPAYNVDHDEVNMGMDWWDARDILVENRRASMNPLWKHMMNISVAARCSPEELYFTNLAKCDDDDSSWQERYDHCHTYFAREIAQVDPRVLLLYGTKVTHAVFEMFGFDKPKALKDVSGEVFETSSLKLVPLYHWGYAYRQGNVDEYNERVRSVVKEICNQ